MPTDGPESAGRAVRGEPGRNEEEAGQEGGYGDCGDDGPAGPAPPRPAPTRRHAGIWCHGRTCQRSVPHASCPSRVPVRAARVRRPIATSLAAAGTEWGNPSRRVPVPWPATAPAGPCPAPVRYPNRAPAMTAEDHYGPRPRRRTARRRASDPRLPRHMSRAKTETCEPICTVASDRRSGRLPRCPRGPGPPGARSTRSPGEMAAERRIDHEARFGRRTLLKGMASVGAAAATVPLGPASHGRVVGAVCRRPAS